MVKMKKIAVKNNQNLVNIAIKEYGSAEGVAQLVADNNGLNYDSVLVSGQILFIDETKILEEQIVRYYDSKKILAATGASPIINNTAGIFDDSFGTEFE